MSDELLGKDIGKMFMRQQPQLLIFGNLGGCVETCLRQVWKVVHLIPYKVLKMTFKITLIKLVNTDSLSSTLYIIESGD